MPETQPIQPILNSRLSRCEHGMLRVRRRARSVSRVRLQAESRPALRNPDHRLPAENPANPTNPITHAPRPPQFFSDPEAGAWRRPGWSLLPSNARRPRSLTHGWGRRRTGGCQHKVLPFAAGIAPESLGPLMIHPRLRMGGMASICHPNEPTKLRSARRNQPPRCALQRSASMMVAAVCWIRSSDASKVLPQPS